MNSARMVYQLIAALILLPWVIFNTKSMVAYYKRLKKIPITKMIVLFIGVGLISTSVYFLYQFTIGYQAPLAAERAGEIFSQRVAAKIDLPTYMETMQKKGLADKSLITVSGEELEQAGFRRQVYDLSISVRTYRNDDKTVTLYFMHGNQDNELYSYVRMKMSRYRWKVIEHKTMSFDQISEVETRMSFSRVKP